MKRNRTGTLCEECHSHITIYKNEDGKIVSECSYCGLQSHESLAPADWEEFK